jgi:recombination protein RecT
MKTVAERITTAVAQQAQQTGPGQIVEQYRRVFDELLPEHLPVGTFVRLSQGLLRRDVKLRQAAVRNPESLLVALVDCARLGHEPGTDQYALVAFGNEITGIEQYQGEIERMFRAGAVESVKCEVVRKNDVFRWRPSDMDVPVHEIPEDGLASDEDRGPLRGVYAYAKMRDGGVSQVIVMHRSEVMRHREVAKTKNIWDGPFEASMWKKTAVHELEKWVPTSAEWLRQRLRAAAEANAQQTYQAGLAVARSATGRPTPPPEEDPVVDAELVEEEHPQEGNAVE